jgi:hypothetical protein
MLGSRFPNWVGQVGTGTVVVYQWVGYSADSAPGPTSYFRHLAVGPTVFPCQHQFVASGPATASSAVSSHALPMLLVSQLPSTRW